MKKINIFGDIHFVTTRTFNNNQFFKDEECCQLFMGILDKLRKDLKFLDFV